MFARIGLFREVFFAFYEETDFCHRAWRSGGRVYYFGKAVVFHVGHVTAGELKKNKTLNTWYLNYRNRLISFVTVLDCRHLLTILLPHLMFNAVSCAFFAGGRRYDLAKAIVKSHIFLLRNLPQLLRERKAVRKNFTTLPEHQIFSQFGLRVSAPKGYYKALIQGKLHTFWSTPHIEAWLRQTLSKRFLK